MTRICYAISFCYGKIFKYTGHKQLKSFALPIRLDKVRAGTILALYLSLLCVTIFTVSYFCYLPSPTLYQSLLCTIHILNVYLFSLYTCACYIPTLILCQFLLSLCTYSPFICSHCVQFVLPIHKWTLLLTYNYMTRLTFTDTVKHTEHLYIKKPLQ